MGFNHREIEAKWQKYWEEHQTFKTDVWDFSKPKFYALDMFPYPSGVGLHVGHPEGYTATDIISRMKRMQGYNAKISNAIVAPNTIIESGVEVNLNSKEIALVGGKVTR